MDQLTLTIDLLIIVSALASSVLWFLSSQSRVRRVSHHEEFDAADINRLVVAMNRTQILSARAAAATGVAAFLAALRLSITTLGLA